ncbi:MAG: DUF4835 family protein [Flavobacteriales bacterium]
MNRITIIVAFILFSFVANAQELRCQVDMLSPTLQNDPENKQILEALQKSIFNFMNNTKWTTEVYKEHEKIESSILITISKRTGTNFEAKIQVTSRRPVYNTNYNSTVVSIVDNSFNFSYQLNAPILFTPGTYTNNLSAVLAFYAYYIVGKDNDTYALEGGTKYLIKAQEIVNQAQSSGQAGWSSSGKISNRYWIMENLLNAQFKGLRKCDYEYHRLGLDLAADDKKVGVDGCTKALVYLQQVHENRPGSANIKFFFVAKLNEIVNVFSEADNASKQTVFNLVRSLDASNMQRYQAILKQR